MIRQVDNSEAALPQPATPTQVSPATAAGKSFASVLAHSKTATGGATTAKAKDAISTPEGEVWRPVAGHDHYAKIVEGPRAGQYINLSRGDRRGEVFNIDVRDGKRMHVYGQGDAQVVVEAGKDSGSAHAHVATNAANHVPKGEEWAPVKGVSNYADILSGKRNGFFVNTSGGVRDGMAFQVVKHGDKTFHVYGEGKHRQMIEVGGQPKKSSHSSSTQTSQATGATTDGTGGASASTGAGTQSTTPTGGTPQ